MAAQSMLPPNVGNLIYVVPTIPDNKKFGGTYDQIAAAVNTATITVGGAEYRIDISELTDYMGEHGAPSVQVRFKGTSINLVTMIEMLTSIYSLSWYAELLFMPEGDPVIIIRIQDNSSDAVGMDWEDFIGMHSGTIISQKEGYTYRTRTAANILINGPNKETLTEFNAVLPFWGWQPGGGDIVMQDIFNRENEEPKRYVPKIPQGDDSSEGAGTSEPYNPNDPAHASIRILYYSRSLVVTPPTLMISNYEPVATEDPRYSDIQWKTSWSYEIKNNYAYIIKTSWRAPLLPDNWTYQDIINFLDNTALDEQKAGTKYPLVDFWGGYNSYDDVSHPNIEAKPDSSPYSSAYPKDVEDQTERSVFESAGESIPESNPILPVGAGEMMCHWIRVPYVPLPYAQFHIPGEPDDTLHHAHPQEINQLINGVTTEPPGWSLEKIGAAVSYGKRYMGTKFVIALPEDSFVVEEPKSAYSQNFIITHWVQVTSLGWWEGETLPENFDTGGIDRFSSSDGRWFGFAKLPQLKIPITGDVESETNISTDMALEWSDDLLASPHVLTHNNEIYIKITAEIFDSYLIITTMETLVAMDQNGRRWRITKLPTVWVPLRDIRLNYGPWSSNDYLDESAIQVGRTEVINDAQYVPWMHGYPGVTHSEAMVSLGEVVSNRIGGWKPTQGTATTGQLEVAALPMVNLGELIGRGGARVDQLAIQYGVQGITTRYSINRKTETQKQIEQNEYEKEKDQIEDHKKEEELNTPEIVNPPSANPLTIPQGPALLPAPEGPVDDDSGGGAQGGEDLSNPWNDIDGWEPSEFEDVDEPPTYGDLAQEIMRYRYTKKKRHLEPLDKPDGGLGLLTSGPGQGPYYHIKRMDARDISEGIAEELLLDGMLWAPTWRHVRNLAEPINSKGYLTAGTRVTVKMFVEHYVVYEDLWMDGSDKKEPVKVARYTPYIEHTPSTFAPPIEGG